MILKNFFSSPREKKIPRAGSESDTGDTMGLAALTSMLVGSESTATHTGNFCYALPLVRKAFTQVRYLKYCTQ